MTSYMERFQHLLRELFQFDCADLDFGIYRIMNRKRDVVERFISEDLPNSIAEEMARGALAEESEAARELQELVAQIRETLGPEAVDSEGNLDPSYCGKPVGTRYRTLREQAAGAGGRHALEATIYNHLYAFFSRYYQDGDFVSKRRYSRRERYAIPYNGEEVYLYWANHDQYYVKTAEYFTNYAFAAPGGVTVHFKLKAADVEQDNVKGDKRFFLPLLGEIAWDEGARELIIPFEYRPLTGQEEIAYGRSRQQDAIVTEMLETILSHAKGQRLKEVLAASCLSERNKTADGRAVTHLEHHLRQYTGRNTSDFFIHKDLKGFLSRELDFYLKNEVLNLDELEAGGEERAEGWFQTVRVIRAVGERIIEFLAQIEEFQKMLWEKRKFVTETQYCITVGNIEEGFYAEIATCDVQWEEWRELFHIDEGEQDLFTGGESTLEGRIAFLRAHPTLVVDTAHFEPAFADRLLGSFENLDQATDGLLVHSENWQALGVLLEMFRGAAECIYIDPPYNSKTTEILYKNTYKHSSWLTLMDNRLAAGRGLAAPGGSHVIAIDENEQEVLGRLLSMHFPEQQRICIAVVHNKKGIQGDYFSYNHDYAYFCIPDSLPETHGKPIPESEWEYTNLRKWGRESLRSTARNCFYPIYVKGGEITRFGSVCPETFHPGAANATDGQPDSVVAVYPVDPKGAERKWRYARASVESIRHLLRVHVTRSGEVQIQKARAEAQFKTVWDDPTYIAGDYGTKWLTDLGLKVKQDLYPKSVHTVRDSVFAVSGRAALVLDYFAGSGTTGHAIINLNREDGGRRKFILVEMADYFDTVLLPRIKKVIYSPEWKDGRPRRMATAEDAERGPRIVKYLRLESYEDALNNIAFDHAAGQQTLQFDDYLLGYMLQWETRGSETLLNVAQLARPFSYRLHIHADGETRATTVDIPETFNYLLGLHVQTRRVYDDDGRRYLAYRGETREGRRVAVIWRETEGWEQADYERDRDFVAELSLAAGADEAYVNGDSLIPGARALEPVFKARMFATVEA